MKLLVISDSHLHPGNIRRALAAQTTRPDAVLFLGDGLADVADIEFGEIPFIAVRGNCDIFNLGGDAMPPYERTVNLDGRNIFMLHGHTRGVENGPERAIDAAVEHDASLLLYGHTHVKYHNYLPAGTQLAFRTLEHDLYIFNPGSIGMPRDGGEPSYGVVELCRSGILTGWGDAVMLMP